MHTVRHRCTEKHSLSLVGHSPEDFLYLRSEAHIKHAISLVEHAAFRCLPAPAPVDVPHEACAWARGDATDADRVEVLRLAGLVARQYASACLSPRAAPTREGDANRGCCAGAIWCLIDAAARMSTVESGTGQDDAFCRRYAGKADRPSAGYAAGAASAGKVLEAITATSLLLDPAACATRAASPAST